MAAVDPISVGKKLFFFLRADDARTHSLVECINFMCCCKKKKVKYESKGKMSIPNFVCGLLSTSFILIQ